MSTDRPNQTETSDGQSLPTTDELVARLDGLWASERVDYAPPANLSGQRVGKYLIREVVGRGAFGIVFRARDEQLERDVAVKVPRPEVLLDAAKLARFESEATAAAALDHPLIVPVYEANFLGTAPYIASAFCGGPDLGRWLAARAEPVPPEEAARFIALLATAVDYAHQHGILHRDLKPGNIMLEPLNTDLNRDQLDAPSQSLADYQPRLTDFGLAKLIESSLEDTRSSLLVGTPLYMAPEQLKIDSQSVTPATDVYALGIVLYELLTLRTPFDGSSYVEVLDNIRTREPPAVRQINPQVPADLDTICAKCLDKDQLLRYGSASELHDELQRYLAGEPIHAKPASRWDRFARWCRQPARLVAAGRFSFWFQIAIIAWLVLVYCLGWVLLPLSPEEYHDTLIAIGLVVPLLHVPKAWLGRKTAARARWAFWPSAISSLALLGIFMSSAFFPSLNPFERTYPTALSKLNTFTALIMAASCDVALHALAVPAWLRQRAR